MTRFVLLLCGFLLYDVTCGFPNQVDIQGPVFLQEPPDEVDFSNSTGATITCSAHGVPKAVITWVLPTGIVVNNVAGLRQVHPNGTLVFVPFRPENYRQDVHATVYRCKAANAVGAIISRDVHVRAVVKQYYEVHVYDEFVINGNTAVLKCNIPSFVRDYVMVTSWVRDSLDNKRHVIVNGGRYSVHSTGELHIRNVQESDGRFVSYRCKTQHRLTGESKLSASAGRLIVTDPTSSVPPRITHGKNSLSAQEGDVVELPCAAQGYPLPTYSWKRLEGNRLRSIAIGGHTQLIMGSLLLRNVKASDAGTYICFVNNTVGEEKLEVDLKVSAPVYVYIEPPKQVIDVGKAALFTCSFSGFPVTDVQWYKDGRPLDTQKIRYQSRDSLQIASVQREDRGQYQCFVSSGQRTTQATAELRLGDAKPQLLQSFKAETLKPGSAFSIRCVASGNPPPQIRWTQDDLPLHSSEHFVMEEQISVHGDVISYVNVSSAMSEDSGEYQCVAMNNVGSVQHAERIDVFGSPFVRAMPNVSAVSGKSWSLRCRVSGYPIRSITWGKDGSVLPINHRQKVFPNGTLVVQDIQRGDAGRYTCFAQGEDSSKVARGDVHVTVVDPPKISPFSFPRDIQEGMRASITCSVFHGNQPITMSWFKDDVAVRSTADLIIRNFDDLTSTLVVQSITPRDSGNYTCVAQNLAAAVNYTAQLLVLVPPRWIHEPKESSVVSGKSIIIDCQADGQPPPTITWKRAIGRLPGEYSPIDYSSGRNYMYANGSLLLISVQDDGQGYYLCQANNSVGAGLSKVIFLKVHAPAYFEEKFRNQTVKKGNEAVLVCESRGDLPIAFEWKVQNQRLDFGKKSRYLVREKVTTMGFASELLISQTGREDTSEYSCLASNEYGKDQAWILLVVQETPEAPQNIKVIPQSSRSFRVSWTLPFDGNSPILQYLLHIKAVSDRWLLDERNVTMNGDETTVVVKDLMPSLEYDISVAAVNLIGVGAMSDKVHIIMGEEVPDGPPTNITVEPVSSQSIRVKWKPPQRNKWNGQIVGYRVGYRPLDSTELFVFTTKDSKKDARNELLLEGLSKYTKYVIIMQAINNIGLGPSSLEVIATTLEDVPSQSPKEIKCIPLSSQSLYLSWKSPPQQSLNGELRGYRIIYKPVEEYTVKPNLEFRTANGTEIELHDLEKHVNYSIQALAYTGAGDGLKSLPVYCRTKEDVPGPPADIKVLPMSSDAIIVSWMPPDYPNGIITKYTVYMRVVDDYRQSALSYTMSPSQFYYEVRSLSENLQYEFWVKASTAIGEGEKTRVISNSPVSTVSARIASFPRVVVANRKDDVKLPCKAVGIPTPDREWLVAGKPVQLSSRVLILDDGTLTVLGFRTTDAANYTCRVQNIYAKDEISHAVTNKHPPLPPIVTITDKTVTSLTVSWTLEDYDGLPVTGMILNSKVHSGDWEEIRLEPFGTYHLLENLLCGTQYHLYMVAYNNIGGSEPSDMITVSTMGNAPEVPERDSILEANSTFIVLYLALWPNGGCPMLHFLVEYKEKAGVDWLVVASNIPRLQNVTITDLAPGTAYILRVNAVNTVGSKPVEFDFVTLDSLIGGPSQEEVTDRSHGSMAFFFDLNVAIPLVSAVVVVIAFLVIACIYVQRWRYGGYLYTIRSIGKGEPGDQALPPSRDVPQKSSSATTTAVTEHQSYDQAYSPTQSRKQYELNKNANLGTSESQNGIHEEISPYATFQLPSNRYGDSADVRFHTFGYEGNKMGDYSTSPQFQYTKVRKKSAGYFHPSNPRSEGIPMSSHPTASKEHVNPLRTASVKKQSETSLQDVCLSSQRELLTPSAPPAEYDGVATDSDTPDIAPHSSKKGNRILNYVPDILDHRPDSSTSNESIPEMDTLPFPKRERSRDRMARPRRIALRTTTSLDGCSSPECGTFSFHKPATPPPGFCDPREVDAGDTTNKPPRNFNDQNLKSPFGLAAVEEELIALLKRGASGDPQQSNKHHQLYAPKENTNNYNDINV